MYQRLLAATRWPSLFPVRRLYVVFPTADQRARDPGQEINKRITSR